MANVLSGSFMSGARVLKENQPREELARRVVLFESEPAEVAAKVRDLPADVLVEPEILHYTDTHCPMDFVGVSRAALAAPAFFGSTTALKAKVQGNGKALHGTEVILFLRAFGSVSRKQQAISDKRGEVRFVYSNSYDASALIAVPAGGFWSMLFRGPTDKMKVDCPALPKAEDSLGWWHRELGISRHAKTRGNGIRVGVADTGLGPHPYLEHATDAGAFIDAGFDPQGGADVDSHGTHVSGTVGARPSSDTEFAGVAPGVQLFSARVFPPGAGANQGDIANAIDALSRDHKVDLINLSLGSPSGSEIERDAIQDALERGTLCICAAGNDDGPVIYPAAFRETVAVSAIGFLGWGPPGSLAAGRVPNEQERFGNGNLYHANFSCYGPEVVCAAPGVGIISTVPARYGLTAPYAAMCGTSMASPAACAALAAILSRSAPYKALPRDETRAAMAVQLLRQNCRSIGLDPQYQGQGIPQVP